jgi:hypothetical protein
MSRKSSLNSIPPEKKYQVKDMLRSCGVDFNENNAELHEEAWFKFGKNKCELCGMLNKDHKKITGHRLSMHNSLDPKDYKVLEPHAWMCLCSTCHVKAEMGDFTKRSSPWKH